MTRTPTLVTASAVLAVVVALAGGCSSAGTDTSATAPAAPTGTSTASGTAGVLATTTTVREVTGGTLPQAYREALRDRVTAVVDAWFEAAFLGGAYPRTDFSDAFGSFAPGAKARAREDQRLMSNAAVGTTTFAVRALARRVLIDVLATGHHASAVTVQFRLGMARAGESGAERRERVSGHLYLTYDDGPGWQVFGYDVQREDLA